MKKLIVSTLFAVCTLLGYSQLTVNNGFTAQQLSNNLAGANITTTNATVLGDPLQYGTFQFNGTGLGVNSGVILSTGDIFDAPGPNSSTSTSTALGGPGDPDLTNLAGSQTYDACVLEFDFEVQSDKIEFNFVFMSEEYNEYVGSGFNDVFAFYISGPGITGQENLAVVPGTTTPVTINSINNNSFWQFYNDNTSGTTDIEFDGFTTLLKAEMDSLQPCGIYTLSMRVADAGDQILDAAVLLQENSLIQGVVDATSNTFAGNNTALEGCIDASFTFSLDSALSTDTYIQIGVGGTATNGIDYTTIDSVLVIPAGQTSATVIVDAIADGITEGQEVVELYYYPEPCEPPDTVFLYIDDYQPLEFTSDPTHLSCFQSGDGEIDFNITGGIPPYTITLTDSATGISTDYTSYPITGLDAGTYYIEIIDGYGCAAEDVVAGSLFDAGQTFIPDGQGGSYSSSIPISGFGGGQTITSANQITSICATMEHSRIGELEILIEAPDGTQLELKAQPGGAVTNMGEPCAIGPADAGNTDTLPGIGYNYCWTNTPTFGTMAQEANNYQYTYTTVCYNTVETDKYLPTGSYTPAQSYNGLIGVPINGNWSIIVTDHIPNNNGYIFDWSISLNADQPDSIVVLEEPELPDLDSTLTLPDCGLSNGAIDITMNGGAPPFTYLWNTGATTEDLSGIPSGQYSVDVTDDSSCTYTYNINLPNNGGISITGVVSDETCPGANDGAIDITAPGATVYSWDSGQTTEDISALAPGTYTVTADDGAGCLGVESFTVNAASQMLTTGTVTNESCGQVDGAIDLSVQGGIPPYTYNWSSGDTIQDPDELAQGTYWVEVTDSNGCMVSDTFEIINLVGNCIPNCDLEITDSIVSDENCGNQDGYIDLTIFTSFSPYTVNWSNGATTDDIYTLTAGTYTATIEDAEGCSIVQDFVINNNANGISISGTVTDEFCGNSAGAIDVSVSGGAMPYSYQWNTGATTEDLSGLVAGTYSITVTDGNGCQSSQSFTVNNASGTLQQTYGNAVDEVCGQSNGSIDIIIQGGNPPYSYQWNTGQTTEDLIGISAGSYQCTITDASGCSIVTPVYDVLNASGGLTIDNIDVDHEYCSQGNGEIEIWVSGGTTPYSFDWNTGQTSQNLFNISAGTYECTITDADGCTVSTGNLDVLNLPGTLALDNISVTDEICGNGQGSVDITITGGAQPYSFMWSTGHTSEDLLNVSAGSYTVVVTDTNDCELTINSSVGNDPGTLSIDNMVVTDDTCGAGSGAIDLYVSGANAPVSYSWSNGASTEDISGLYNGSYTVDVTDAAGCTQSGTATVANNTGSLNVSVDAVVNEVCGDGQGSIDISVTGGASPYTYSWSNGASTEDISNLSAGTYSCTVTDNNGCAVLTGSINVGNNSGGLSMLNIAITDEVCGNGNGAIDITVTGGTTPYTYSWSTGATTQDITGISAGTYTVDVTDANGCTINSSIDIVNTSGTLSLDSTLITDEMCGNGQGAINIAVSGGTSPYTYAWSHGPTTEDVSGLSSGTYSCVITDANGCQVSTGSLNINDQSGSLTITDMFVSNENCGDGQGSIDLSINGGTSPYTYNWSTGDASQDITGLSQGVYTVTVTDVNGCSATGSATVQNGSGNLAIIADTITNATCGNGNGAINIVPDGGAAPLSFIWSNGETTEDITGLTGGTYTVIVSDASGCQLTYSGTVNSIGGNFQISNVSVVDEACGASDGSVTVSVNGGSSPYVYDWGPLGIGGSSQTGLSAGTYSVLVTDANGCVDSATATVNNGTGSLSIDGMIVTNDFCGMGNGSIDLQVSGGAGPYNYNWSSGQFWEDINNLTAGTYWVEVTDQNGCTISDTTVVSNTTSGLTLSAAVTNDLCSQGSGSIDLTASGAPGPYQFQWSNGETTEDITGLTQGWYTVDVTDANGCSQTDSFYVDNVNNGFTASAVTTDENCGDGTGAIDVTVSGGITPYTFLWDDASSSTTEDLSGLNAGIYTVIITDDIGCQITITDTVNNITGGLTLSGVVTDQSCSAVDGAIDLTVTGGATPYTFNWSNGATTEDISNIPAGAYTCTITDASNCSLVFTDTVYGGSAGLNIDSIQVVDETCGDTTGSVTAYVSGGSTPYSYDWQGISPCCNYTIRMYDSFGDGWNGGELSVFVNGVLDGQYAPFADSLIITVPVCNGDNFELSYADGNWENENTYEVYDGYGNLVFSDGPTPATGNVYAAPAACPGGGPSLVDLNAGSYTLIITDSNGCSDTSTAVVNNDPGTLSIDAMNVTDESCNAGDGSIDITVSGGSGSYGFSWSNGETTEDIANLSAGSYTVTVDDGSGCQVTDSASVINNTNGFMISSLTATDENCGDTTGTVDLTVTGGGTPYTYNWSNGETTEDLTNLNEGWYTISVTEAGGCTITDSVYVNNVTNGLSATASVVHDTCGNLVGAIDLVVTGGTAPITYDWSTGATTEDVSGLGVGVYTVAITDATGCTLIQTYTVTDAGTPPFVTGFVTEDFCQFSNGAIDLQVNGNFPFTYQWSNGATTEDINNLSAGTYYVDVTDGNGCTATDTFTVTADAWFQVDNANITDVSCTTCTDGAIDITILTAGTYSYNWSNGSTMEDPSGLATGWYSVIITDDNNCVVEDSFYVDIDTSLNVGVDIFDVKFDVYPNPSNGQFTIEITKGFSKDMYVEVYDMLGKLIYGEGEIQSDRVNIDLSSVERGVYNVSIIKDGIRKNKRIVIQR